MTKFTEAERAGLAQLKDQIQNRQRSEFPKDSRLEFAKRLRDKLLREEFDVPGQAEEDSAAIKAAKAHLEQARQEMPLLEHAEDIRARIEARAKHDNRARKRGLPVTRLGMRMELVGKSEKEMISLGMVAGTGSDEEDGTVSISYLMIKLGQSGHPVKNQLIKAKIFRGGRFSIRQDVGYFGEQQKSEGYSVIYPRPDRPEFGGETKVLDDGQATKFLGMLEFLVDRCLTQPNLSFSPKIGLSRRVLLK